MGVEREETTDFLQGGKTTIVRAIRQANGQWSVEFVLDYTLTLPDGRQIRVSDRHVMVRATEQRGRRPAAGPQAEFMSSPASYRAFPGHWPGTYGLCADGQPHVPRPGVSPLVCGRCENELL